MSVHGRQCRSTMNVGGLQVGLGEQVIAALCKTEQILISELTSIGVKGFA
jgi:hypothetical protein